MRYTPEIHDAIVAQIKAEPDREVILPDWAYWKGVETPWVYVDQMPTRLVVVLYESIIGPLPVGAGLSPAPGSHRRNVNPHQWVVVPTVRSRATCPNGHDYTEDDYVENVGHRCQACRAMKLLGTPSATDLNRAKTVCPNNHPLTKGNLVRLKNGRRRCLICHRETQARHRARKNGTSE